MLAHFGLQKLASPLGGIWGGYKSKRDIVLVVFKGGIPLGRLRYDENIFPPSNFGKLNKHRIGGNELTTIFFYVCST